CRRGPIRNWGCAPGAASGPKTLGPSPNRGHSPALEKGGCRQGRALPHIGRRSRHSQRPPTVTHRAIVEVFLCKKVDRIMPSDQIKTIESTSAVGCSYVFGRFQLKVRKWKHDPVFGRPSSSAYYGR